MPTVYARDRRFLTAAAIVALQAACLSPIACGDSPTFNRDVRPLLSDRCFACHGPDSAARQAELRLDRREIAVASAISPGDADGSELIARITMDDPDLKMPPADANKPAFTPEEVDILRRWIDAGAEYEPHWAYLAPTRPAIPAVKNVAWPRTDVDRLLLARMEERGVAPAIEADRRTLLRRAWLDLVGLPPTPEEVDAFAKDGAQDAFERRVDALLASPRFGERMAVWWLDLVRFANTVGYHGDQEHGAIPYRDYVIRAFNENLPFDQFTIEQLAGDLLDDPSMWQLIATCYNRILQTTHEGGAQNEEYLAIMLADRVRNVSEVWLGATMGCSQCHDHKFDPLLQRDFYSLGAFFADVDRYGSFEPIGTNDLVTRRPPEMLAWTLPVSAELSRVDEQIGKLETQLRGDLPKEFAKLQIELEKLEKRRAELQASFIPVMITRAVEPRPIRVLSRGDWMDKSGEVVDPGTPSCLPPLGVEGRRATRLDLARWLVSRDNPLTARVTVNRLWKQFYGRGLVASLGDLGSQTQPPEDQTLLDWLAVDFVDGGWDVKRLIRQMVVSSAYRQSSALRPELDSIDPRGQLFARQQRFRLEAEQVRDTVLATAGLLNEQVGGGDCRPYQPAGYYSQLNFPEREYESSRDAQQYRRGVYVHWQRQFLHPFLKAFDAPSREECTAQRPVSNTPSAALVLLNDPSMVEAARKLAARAVDEALPSDGQRIAWIWRQTLQREPTAAEVAVIEDLLAASRRDVAADPPLAEKILTVGLASPPPADRAAEVAAWSEVCRTVYNLHETISRN
jgi:hypothetical protein